MACAKVRTRFQSGFLAFLGRQDLRPAHSCRSAVTGSTRVARLAGRNPASAVKASNNSPVAASVGGSIAFTPKSSDSIYRVNTTTHTVRHKL